MIQNTDTTTRTELEALIGEVVCLQLKLDSTHAEMEREISRVRSLHQNEIDALELELVQKRARVQMWAEENREAFRSKKSLECHHGTIGFRSGPPRLEKIKTETPWQQIAQKLRRMAWGSHYVRTPKPDAEVNKEAILADRHKLPADKLIKAGLRIVQDEKFYITLRSRAVENLLQAAA